jgi:hypothetical protein
MKLYDLQLPPSSYPVDTANIRSLIEPFRTRKPFFLELRGDYANKLLVGLGADAGCIQYSAVNGDAPYWMAIDPHRIDDAPHMGFLINDTATEVDGRYRLSIATLTEVIATFIATGEKSPVCSWESL